MKFKRFRLKSDKSVSVYLMVISNEEINKQNEEELKKVADYAETLELDVSFKKIGE